MKDLYLFTRKYILNGIFGYAILGFYALTVSPFVTKFIDYGEKSLFVFLFGMTMLVLEFFAFRFKLMMIKARSVEKRIAYRKLTGKDFIPRPGAMVIFAFFTRLFYRIGIFIISLLAISIHIADEKMSNAGTALMIIIFVLEFYGLTLTYIKTRIYEDTPPYYLDQWETEESDAEWEKPDLSPLGSSAAVWKELLADIILQVYAIMLFTAFWSYLNGFGIRMVEKLVYERQDSLPAFMQVFPMLFIFLFLGLMPIRIAYWIEDSIMAFSRKERLAMWIVFLVTCIMTCFPTILTYISAYFFDLRFLNGTPYLNINLILTVLLLLLIVVIRIWLARDKAEVACFNCED